MKLSVKPVPAARTLMRTSPGPGLGIVDSSASSKTSGPPNRDMRTCCHDMFVTDVLSLSATDVESTLAHSNPASEMNRLARASFECPAVALGPCLRRSIIDVAYGSKHKVAALQPAARGQEPRGRKPAERTALAGLRA